MNPDPYDCAITSWERYYQDQIETPPEEPMTIGDFFTGPDTIPERWRISFDRDGSVITWRVQRAGHTHVDASGQEATVIEAINQAGAASRMLEADRLARIAT